MPNVFGGMCFNNKHFKDFMNQFYFPAEKMKSTVDSLKAKIPDMSALKWGDYQHILADPESWPKGPLCPPGLNWDYFKDWARNDLVQLANFSPLSHDQPDVVPPTRCALLDLSVRKCFNSVPPIPMIIDVQDKDADSVNP